MNERIIQVNLRITSGQSDGDVREMIEQVLLNSALNNSEFKLHIDSTIIIPSTEPYDRNKIAA